MRAGHELAVRLRDPVDTDRLAECDLDSDFRMVSVFRCKVIAHFHGRPRADPPTQLNR